MLLRLTLLAFATPLDVLDHLQEELSEDLLLRDRDQLGSALRNAMCKWPAEMGLEPAETRVEKKKMKN